jgi:hypothetical protein
MHCFIMLNKVQKLIHVTSNGMIKFTHTKIEVQRCYRLLSYQLSRLYTISMDIYIIHALACILPI